MDHRIYIYVFSSDVPIRVPDTLYENQRYIPLHGYSQSGLFPTDRYAWSDETGVKDTPKESFRLPSAHWSWEGDWMVDENLRGEVAGVEGWQYAIDFPSSHYTPENHWNSCVRKRKWIRFRRFTSTDVWVRISDMEVVEISECFIDVSVGGFYLPSQLPGFLSVWAVTNTGHVYVRTKVCHDQPEGVSWEKISLGSHLGVINICVGASNLVWAITWDGQALVRTGINRNNKYGTQWEIVEPPDDTIRFMQVAVGKNVVWALSREGKVWFRKGTWGDDIQGNISSFIGSMWVEMVGDMSCIAVSANDRVFAIDSNDGGVYFRDGVTSSNLTGKTWQKISLHEDISLFETAESCTCSSESSRCDFHKRRADSLTTSCSSTSTYTWTDEPLSDAFPSAQSPVPIPSSDVEKTEKDCDNTTEDFSSKEKDFSNTTNVNTSFSEEQNTSDKKADRMSSSSLVHNFEPDDQFSKVDSLQNDTTDSHVLLEQQEQDQNIYSNPQDDPPVNDNSPSVSIDSDDLQLKSGETKIKSLVNELTEVDRFLVEKEILQSPNVSSLSVLHSSIGSNSCDIQKNESNVITVSDASYQDFTLSENNLITKCNKGNGDSNDEQDGDHDKIISHSKIGAKSSDDVPTKMSKHKHKSKHTKKLEQLSLGDESDSIVYKNPKAKKKKKKSDSEMQAHNKLTCDESKHNVLIENFTETVHLSTKCSQSELDDSSCETRQVEELSQSIVDSVDSKNNEIIQSKDVVPQEHNSVNLNSFPVATDNITNGDSCTSFQEFLNKTSELSLSDQQAPLTADRQILNLDINGDIRFQQNKHEVNVDSVTQSEPLKAEQPGSFSGDVSLDSPVSDKIFDFVTFVDENEDDQGDRVDSTSEVKDVQELFSSKTGSVSLENLGDKKTSEPFEMSSASCMQEMPERSQIIPLQPARKVFRNRSTPSPSIVSNRSSFVLDSEASAQTRYAWRSLDVSALHVDDASTVRWLSFKNRDAEEKKNAPKIISFLRNDIMAKLKARNRREIYQFQNFEQAVKYTTWVKKSAMQVFVRRGGGQWVACNVELEQNKSDQSNKCLTIIYSSKKHQKVKKVVLKNVTCVKSSTSPDLIRTTIIIYTLGEVSNPVVLQAASESEANEWTSLLCTASASQCNLDQPIPAGSIWTCIKSGAIVVSPSKSLETKSGEFFWGQHGGHMNLIETGSSGVTWGIGFDRLTYVYNGGYGGAVCTDLPGMSNNLQEMIDFHRIYVYEHQTRFPVLGWCSKGMLGNNFNWTTETGKSMASQDDVKLPSSKWQWVSSWAVDFNTHGGVNSEGWQFSTLVGDFHSSQHVKDMYRRRRWVRTCRLNTQGPWMSAGSLSLHDISIQVDPVTSSSAAIVLWAVGTNGDVLCRCGVTKDNPLGQSWIHIPTYLDKPFVSISVGGGWRVWGIAGDGSTWYRSGVSQYSPAGKCWLQVVEPPPGNGILRQVSAGSTAVWAVDTEDNLWRRKNITRTFPEGTDWELVAARVKRVSVGPKDQVWIITTNRFNNSSEASGCIYRRIGITDDKPGGTKWEKVIGEAWSYVSIRGTGEGEL